METVPLINKLLKSNAFTFKVVTKDWHPADHISFASNQSAPNNKPFESTVEVSNIVAGKPDEKMQQRLWPAHCIQGTKGAELLPELDISKVDLVVEKGADARIEMYSAFADSFGNLVADKGGVNHDLAKALREHEIKDVYCVGIAGDVCVNFTALDAAKSGFTTYVIEEGQRSVTADAWAKAKEGLKAKNVGVLSESSQQVQQLLSG